MFLAIDVGNTQTTLGLFGEDGAFVRGWRMATDASDTSDALHARLFSYFAKDGLDLGSVTDAGVASVVPALERAWRRCLETHLGHDPLVVRPGHECGMEIAMPLPRQVGADRIANAVAAQAEYGGPCVFIDFGTATTFGAIDAQGAFAGGCICPGLKLTSDALVTGTAKLPRFELVKPDHVIGRTTLTNLQSGLIYGYIGQVHYLVQRMRRELNAPNAFVVATGGMARLVVQEDSVINKLDGILTLKGMRLIYERNR